MRLDDATINFQRANLEIEKRALPSLIFPWPRVAENLPEVGIPWPFIPSAVTVPHFGGL